MGYALLFCKAGGGTGDGGLLGEVVEVRYVIGFIGDYGAWNCVWYGCMWWRSDTACSSCQKVIEWLVLCCFLLFSPLLI